MRKKGVSFIYEIRAHIKDLEENIDLCLNDLQENGAEILDIKTCLNSENDILVTIIYEYDELVQILPESVKNK